MSKLNRKKERILIDLDELIDEANPAAIAKELEKVRDILSDIDIDDPYV